MECHGAPALGHALVEVYVLRNMPCVTFNSIDYFVQWLFDTTQLGYPIKKNIIRIKKNYSPRITKKLLSGSKKIIPQEHSQRALSSTLVAGPLHGCLANFIFLAWGARRRVFSVTSVGFHNVGP